MASLKNRITSLVAMAALGFGAYTIAPNETRALVASAADLVEAAVAALPNPGAGSGDGSFALPNPAELFNSQAAQLESTASDHSFLVQSPDGTPVRWDSCTPIRVVVNVNNAPEGASDEVNEALNRISAITGLTFNVEGFTDEIPQSERYKEVDSDGRPLPLIIAWASIEESDMLVSDDDSGRATANPMLVNGEERYVTGAVVLNSAHNDLYRPGFGPGATRGNLLMHEIGHAVGLGHAEGANQLMSPQLGSKTPDGFTTGDLAGLSELGAARGCAA